MKRKILKNPDGSISSEESLTVTHPKINQGLPTNIPSIFNGRRGTQARAEQKVIRAKGTDPETGRRLKAFTTIAEAEKEAQRRSKMLGRQAFRQGMMDFGKKKK